MINISTELDKTVKHIETLKYTIENGGEITTNDLFYLCRVISAGETSLTESQIVNEVWNYFNQNFNINEAKVTYSMVETANRLNISKRTLSRMIHDNKVKYMAIGNSYRFTDEEIERLQAERKGRK